MKTVLLLAVLVLGSSAVQEMSPADPLTEHKWLQQLVGEWDMTSEATMEPGAPPTQWTATESVRAIGGLWIVAESQASFDGNAFTSIMTLGYDPERKAFVGSWIDSMQTQFWTYTGSLDEGRKLLTLATEGPSFDDPSRRSEYHDVIEIVDRDHKVLTSAVRGEDGTWNTFMRAEYTRRK